ncbi:MAG: phosphatase PAP2 family protein [Gemmataceae bacterium]
MSADPVLHWNEVALHAAVVDHGIGAPGLQFGPTRTGRALAIVQGAVFDAVNSIQPQYAKYLIQIADAQGASIDAAVAEAAYTTLVSLYPYQQPYFDTELAASLQNIPTDAKIKGVAVGGTVAGYILNVRADDRSAVDAPGQPSTYIYGQQPGQWRADPLHSNPAPPPLTPNWGAVTPFVVHSATQFGAPRPPALTSLAYALAYEQVKAVGALDSAVRTDNETDIGFFWGYDAQPGLCAPVRFYNQIAEEVAKKFQNSVAENARFFALVNFALADAGITCWNDKYRYDLWRPITAIRENDPGTGPTGLGSGNRFLVGQGDPNWEPLGAPADNGGGTNFTPPFPAYTSGHATFGGAAFKIMEDFYHTDIIPGGLTFISDEFNTITVDQNGIQRPLRERTYNSFSQMAGENAQSRIYLGIHWQFDAIEGIRCGDGIADYIFTHALKPLTGGRPVAMPSLNPVLQIAIAVALEDVAAHGGLGGHDFFIAGETRSTAVPSPLSGPRSAKFSAPVNLVSREHDAEPTLGWLQSAHAHGANFADLFGDIFAFDYGW